MVRVAPDEFYNSQYGKKYSRIHQKDYLRKMKRQSLSNQLTYGPPFVDKWAGVAKMEGYGYKMPDVQKLARGIKNQ